MDLEPKESGPESEDELISRPASLEDLVDLCRELNGLGAKYIVVGGFAIRAAGYLRQTRDVDYLIDTSLENEARVRSALGTLPDNAVRDLQPGEVGQYAVVRIADEFVVDLMASACGITYADALPHTIIREVEGVPIPFASPRLLWAMKATTHREKDRGDLFFLRQEFGDEIFGPDGKPRPLDEFEV